jgi:arabinoxylan arabinofuranohydrolase
MTDQTIDIPANTLKDVNNNLYLFVAEATDFYVDAWQFTEADPSGIQTLESSKALKTQRYDLSGRRLSGVQQHRGIVIEQYTDENGVKHSRKVLAD